MTENLSQDVSLYLPKKIFAGLMMGLDAKEANVLGVRITGGQDGATLVGTHEALVTLGLGELLAESLRIADENRSRSFGN